MYNIIQIHLKDTNPIYYYLIWGNMNWFAKVNWNTLISSNWKKHKFCMVFACFLFYYKLIKVITCQTFKKENSNLVVIWLKTLIYLKMH